MKWVAALALIGSHVITTASLACAKHPGMTHEQWTSSIKSEKDKNGNEQSMSRGFFDSKPAEAAPQGNGSRLRGRQTTGERRIREVQ